MSSIDPAQSYDELRAAARQILDDIEAMAVGKEFGEFSEWRTSWDGEGVIIAWANLEISAARLRRALRQATSVS